MAGVAKPMTTWTLNTMTIVVDHDDIDVVETQKQAQPTKTVLEVRATGHPEHRTAGDDAG